MNFKLKVVTFILTTFGLLTLSCRKDNNAPQPESLEAYLQRTVDFIHDINGFYVLGMATNPTSSETTPGTTGEEIFDHAVRLFSSFLDQDNDGKVDADKEKLNTYLANTMMFISGHLEAVDEVAEAGIVISKGLYVIGMQTDSWPYVRDYNGKGWTVNSLNSSLWRPQSFNALWEEIFHTITEAISRSDSEFAFSEGAKLRELMDADIAAGTYDISEQNQLEEGNYDRVTAVNEYIHQIWAINFASQDKALNNHQLQALDFMKSKNVPMQVNANYDMVIGKRVK